jgi:hypothetical protein
LFVKGYTARRPALPVTSIDALDVPEDHLGEALGLEPFPDVLVL